LVCKVYSISRRSLNIENTEGYIRWLCAAFTSAAITMGIEHDLS
jgi:hypothetical protein